MGAEKNQLRLLLDPIGEHGQTEGMGEGDDGRHQSCGFLICGNARK
jgi:hypothetical protein